MKVSFRTKYSDIIAFNFYFFSRSPIVFGIIAAILIVGIKPNLHAVINTASDKSLLFQILFFAILELVPVFLMCIILASCLLLFNISKKFKTAYTDETITLGNDVSITLCDDVIRLESIYSPPEVQWAAIQALVQTHSHIFMFAKPRRNLIIPKRAFESDEVCEQFWRQCQAKVKTSSQRN